MFAAAREPPSRLIFGGDAMLGRLVRDAIVRHGPGYPLGAIAPLLREADLAVVNLECAITSSNSSSSHWHGAPKAFYFGAPPGAIETLADAGIGLVSLANNHALDYDVQGLLQTIRALDEYGIAHAGAGDDLAGALQAAIVQRQHLGLGMAAFCDHQGDFAAANDCPGIAWLDMADEAAAIAAFADALAPLSAAAVNWPILSLHWGPNMVWRPEPRQRRLAHAAIDMGWKIVYGHSAHVFHGVELYRGCPIIYAAGDLVDDYYVDPAFRNDHQLLFDLRLAGGALERIVLHPLFIENCRTVPATTTQREWIFGQMARLCAELGTATRVDGAVLAIEPIPAQYRAPS
jgi:poly-gamma-glutamate synthesis protein (capsule biosynthesis protein)